MRRGWRGIVQQLTACCRTVGQNADSLIAALWMSWCFVADPGTHADQGGFLGRIVAFGITIGVRQPHIAPHTARRHAAPPTAPHHTVA